MTGERVKEVCALYVTKLFDFPPQAIQNLSPETPNGAPDRLWDHGRALQHIHWMALETRKFVDEGRVEKAMRWLGFMQGWLTAFGVYTIGDTMLHNAPPGTKFDTTR